MKKWENRKKNLFSLICDWLGEWKSEGLKTFLFD